MDPSLPAATVLPFEHTYAQLPPKFWQRVDPTPVKAPRMLAYNDALAAELGITRGDDAAQVFAGNVVPAGALPLAMAYAGHQFGHFVPQLGDGRAILLGELIDRKGRRRDLQLKGAGPTAFSRNGDGRAAIGPVLREYLISEAMHAMGVPTTRSLAAVATGEHVFREGAVPGAVLARVAASHVRVGTFQYFAARRDTDGVRQLADHVIARHYPDAAQAPRPYLALLEAVARRQAALVVQWQQAGFIHGVMNTDNTTLSGETIDYGPCAFLDDYDPTKVFSSIDRAGRYSFSNQPALVRWNVARLAETLLAIIDSDGDAGLAAASAVIDAMPGWSETAWLQGMRAKLGLASEEEGDLALAKDLLEAMHAVAADYTLVFRGLGEAAAGREPDGLLALPRSPAFDAWRTRWLERSARETVGGDARCRAMNAVNPAVIPRNHRVHEALLAAEQGDLGPFEALLAAVRAPYADTPSSRPYMLPPEPAQRVLQTFCGT